MIENWLGRSASDIARELSSLSSCDECTEPISGFGMKNRVKRFISYIRTAMYPNIYYEGQVVKELKNALISDYLRQGAMLLYEMCLEVLPEKENCSDVDGKIFPGKSSAGEITVNFMNSLPEIGRILKTDITAAYEGDPAARSEEEILLAYPAFEAISIFRLAHRLFELGVPLVPRMMTEYAHQLTGIDIHPGATIGPFFFIDHGTGVVIGETCVIGSRVKLYQGVTLGAKSFENDENGNPVKGVKRHPDICDGVVIYSGATILGGDTVIGKNAVIGGNVWLTESVSEGKVVYYDPKR